MQITLIYKCPPTISSELSTQTIQPSPPNGDFNTYENIRGGSVVGLVMIRISPPPGAQVSYNPNTQAFQTNKRAPQPNNMR